MQMLIAAIPPVRPLDVVSPVEVLGDVNRMRVVPCLLGGVGTTNLKR